MLRHPIYTADDMDLLKAQIAALQAENDELIALVDRPQQQSTGSKGSLSRMVEDMVLNTTMSYAAIVEAVLAEHPTARTTTRSVASVACVLRRTHPVPHRTKQDPR